MTRTPTLIATLSAVAASAVLGGCATYHVRTDSDATLIGTVHCHTVAWAGEFKGTSPLRNSAANPLNESRLRDAIALNLRTAGITLADAADSADCLVGYGIGVKQVADEIYPDGWYGGGWGWRGGFGWGWGGGPWGGWDAAPVVYNQGFIAVDLYDNKTKRPMWHGTTEQNLEGVTGEDAAHRIQAAVAAIFSKFPR